MKTNLTKSVRATVAIILAATTLMLAFCSCSVGKTKIKLEDCVTVEYSSFNRHATAALTVDYDVFDSLVENQKMVKYLSKLDPEDAAYYEYYGENMALSMFLEISFAEDYKNLANGDVIIVTATPSNDMENKNQTLEDIEKGLGISIKDAEIKVEGLVDAKEIDIFQNIEDYVSFEGINGKGKLVIDIPEETTFEVDGIYFKCDNYQGNVYSVIHNNEKLGTVLIKAKPAEDGYARGGYTKGDVCTLMLDYSGVKLQLEALGYVAKAEEYDITVPDLGSYITSKDQLTAEDMEILKKALMEKTVEEGYTNPEIMATYFSSIKPGEVCDEEDKNIFVCIIAADKTAIFTTRRGAHITEAYGIIKNDSGEIRYETAVGWGSYGSEGEAIEAYNDNYTLEKIS